MYTLRETLEMAKKLDAEKKAKTQNTSNYSTATGYKLLISFVQVVQVRIQIFSGISTHWA